MTKKRDESILRRCYRSTTDRVKPQSVVEFRQLGGEIDGSRCGSRCLPFGSGRKDLLGSNTGNDDRLGLGQGKYGVQNRRCSDGCSEFRRRRLSKSMRRQYQGCGTRFRYAYPLKLWRDSSCFRRWGSTMRTMTYLGSFGPITHAAYFLSEFECGYRIQGSAGMAALMV